MHEQSCFIHQFRLNTHWGMMIHWYAIHLLRCRPGFDSWQLQLLIIIWSCLKNGCMDLWGGKRCVDDIADDNWFIQATAHAQKLMGVSMRIMSHALEGQDLNPILITVAILRDRV